MAQWSTTKRARLQGQFRHFCPLGGVSACSRHRSAPETPPPILSPPSHSRATSPLINTTRRGRKLSKAPRQKRHPLRPIPQHQRPDLPPRLGTSLGAVAQHQHPLLPAGPGGRTGDGPYLRGPRPSGPAGHLPGRARTERAPLRRAGSWATAIPWPTLLPASPDLWPPAAVPATAPRSDRRAWLPPAGRLTYRNAVSSKLRNLRE
jgi:hypothetical protein